MLARVKLGWSRVVANHRSLCVQRRNKNDEMAQMFPRFFTLDDQKYTHFFLYRGDRQMTEIFVSGTEVFSDAKMTESPYE